jgi:hypothetical protein
MKLPTVDEAGVIAVSLSENMKESDQAMFIAGFQEAIKYLKLKEVQAERIRLNELLDLNLRRMK